MQVAAQGLSSSGISPQASSTNSSLRSTSLHSGRRRCRTILQPLICAASESGATSSTSCRSPVSPLSCAVSRSVSSGPCRLSRLHQCNFLSRCSRLTAARLAMLMPVVSSASTHRRVSCCSELTCWRPVSVRPSRPAATRHARHNVHEQEYSKPVAYDHYTTPFRQDLDQLN